METDKEKSKESAITEAALELFKRYGFKRVTMEDIAQRTGMSRPALYLSFKSKEEIMRAVLRSYQAQALQRVEVALTETEGLRERLSVAFEIWAIEAWVMLRENPDARDLIDTTLEFASDLMNEGYERFESQLVSVLREEGVEDEAERIARTLWVSVRGAKDLARDEADLRALIATLIDMAAATVRA